MYCVQVHYTSLQLSINSIISAIPVYQNYVLQFLIHRRKLMHSTYSKYVHFHCPNSQNA